MNCDHSWEPISGWSARYKCVYCKVIGFRKVIIVEFLNKKERISEIVPYSCQKKGCLKLAQASNKSGKKFCFDHWKKEDYYE